MGHLGGFKKGGDEATWYPDLWSWLIDVYNVRSMIDIGCGEGLTCHFFSMKLAGPQYGLEERPPIIGIDGVPHPDPFILQHDYTKGVWVDEHFEWHNKVYDLGWCCEFVEHVEEQYVHNFINTFKKCKTVLMTHAFPGQEGYHHVNCKDPYYWVTIMREAGFKLDAELTIQTRKLSEHNQSPWNHYLRSGLAFNRL